ncbi:MAG: hypothetical protein K9W44_16005 [Candidatus Lokiarchaeota archaeon]|nr:hypothetical protein [Candidatus Harpocratesius repetitus]
MNPIRFDDEVDYYLTLLDKFETSVCQNKIDLDTFFAKEIIDIMLELKQERDNIPLMLNITKNMLLILLSFYHEQRNFNKFTSFCELEDCDKELVRSRFIPLISN